MRHAGSLIDGGVGGLVGQAASVLTIGDADKSTLAPGTNKNRYRITISRHKSHSLFNTIPAPGIADLPVAASRSIHTHYHHHHHSKN